MKGLNLPTDLPPAPKAAGSIGSSKPQIKLDKQREEASEKAKTNRATLTDDSSSNQAVVTKADRKEEKRRLAQEERAKAEENKKRAQKVQEVASKAEHASSVRKDTASQLLLTPSPQWMATELDALFDSAAAGPSVPTTASISHEQAVALLGRGTQLFEADNAQYHTLLNSGSAKLTAQLGGLTPSDAKFISSLLGDTSSISGSGGQGGTLSDRIAAHALLLGSSPVHNLRSLDALLAMSAKKNREESGRAVRALADWFAGSGLGSSGRKLRYFRDQPELAVTASAPPSRARDQRLALFAYEDRLKKTYFTFLQTLETQSHDTLPFVRQQAVAQVFILLREKSEQEQNLLRLLVNKLGDGERSVASKATNHLLELLNVHPNMKSIVAREVGELIHKPTRSSTRGDKEATKKHQMHAKYYGVLMLNQIMLTRQDVEVANLLIQLYFELFEEALNDEAFNKAGMNAEDKGEETTPANKEQKTKQRWRNNKGKGGKKGKDSTSSDAPRVVQDADGKMMAAILTGVRRAFPFANLNPKVFDQHLHTLFRITHSSSFNIAVQALQLIYVVATSSKTTSTHLVDRFHSTLYSSMLDPRLGTSSKTAMYLNLCFKAIRDDDDDDRRSALVKRLTQILSQMDVEFVCGALFLIGELVRAHPRLRGMLVDAEDDDEEIIANPPDDETEPKNQIPAPAHLHASNQRYDGHKRDPRFARAKSTCLWEISALLEHFHPTVRLLSAQLVRSEPLTTTPDLTLYSLSHFLDRFVYRNAKKKGSFQKGASGMQPALGAAAGGEDGVRKVKGWHAASAGDVDEVNTESFWKRKVADVPVDSLFFHHYFTLKGNRDGVAGKKKVSKGDDGASEDDNDDSLASEEVDDAPDAATSSDASDASDDSDEEEIWKAMKASMPGKDGDDDLLDDDDDDDEDLEQYDYTDSEDEDNSEKVGGKTSKQAQDKDALSSDGDSMFDEDEDDLLPFAEFGDEDDESGSDASDVGDLKAGTKRSRGAQDEGEGETVKSKSQQRRAERKKRKAMPTFASADDYAHLLGGDDDGDDDLGA